MAFFWLRICARPVDGVPTPLPSSQGLREAIPWLETAYTGYARSPVLAAAVQEDAAMRFIMVRNQNDFSLALAHRAVAFIEGVASARYVTRF